MPKATAPTNPAAGADVHTFHAPGHQAKVISSSGRVAIIGHYGTWTVMSTDAANIEYGYCSLRQHTTYGEYVFAYRNAAAISNPPTRDTPDITVDYGEPFAYASLSLQGVYSFKRAHYGDPVLVRHSGAAVSG